ncbi:MAG: hypothetical protein LBI61_02575 [Puniceicoccales bacterium]|jgi:hypothetical protein|nr:hypothetical protein [Puniceicoccales bacterium]
MNYKIVRAIRAANSAGCSNKPKAKPAISSVGERISSSAGNMSQPASELRPTGISERAVVAGSQPARVIAQDFEHLGYERFLQESGRRKRTISGNGCNRCGFNAMACQIRGEGKKITAEDLRNLLGYNSKDMFANVGNGRGRGISSAAEILKQPVIIVSHDGDRITSYDFSIPNIGERAVFLNKNANLRGEFESGMWNYFDAGANDVNFQAYGQFRREMSRWANVKSGRTLYDVIVDLQKNKNAVVLLHSGNHFDAAIPA